MAQNPAWADLPQELLTSIANSLPTNLFDIPAFRSVCKSWYSSAPYATPSPILSPPLPLTIPAPPDTLSGRWVFLSVTVVYAFHAPEHDSLSAPPIWIGFVDQFNKDKLRFRLPFSNQSFNMPFNFPRYLNLLDFRAAELGRFYNLIDVFGFNDQSDRNIVPDKWFGGAAKVVLLSDMSCIVTLSGEGKLGLFRLGMKEWEIVHYGLRFRFDDIVEYKGRVLGVDRGGRVYDIGLDNPFTINPIVPPIGRGGGRRKRLVESLGKLYLVIRCNDDVFQKDFRETVAFKVYQIEERNWCQVTDLGGMVFLFGVGFSLSTSTQRLGGCFRENCIIFEHQSFRNYNEENDEEMMFRELGMNDLFIGVWHLDNASHIGVIGSYPGYSGLLWPPPSWIWPIDRFKRLGEVAAAVDGILMMVPDSIKGMIQEERFTITYEQLTYRDQNALVYFREVHKLKIMLNHMKEFDKALTGTATNVLKDYGSYTKLLKQSSDTSYPSFHYQSSQLETSYLSAKMNHPCVMLNSVANQIYSKHNGDGGNWREKVAAFNCLILSLEKSTSKARRLCKFYE